MAESRRGSYRMWGDDGGSIVDCSDVGAARGVARSGAIIRSGGGRSRSGDAAVAGGLDQRADCGGVLRAAGQRAALALDIWPRGGSWAARAQGARPRAGQGAGCVNGRRGGVGAGGLGSAELDLAALGRRDREANRRAHLEIAAQRGAEKGGFAWRRPRHTLKGRQDADAVDRSGLRLRLRLLKQQAEAGDITLLFGDESEVARASRGASLPAHPIM